MLKNNIRFQHHINRVSGFVVLEKLYLSCMVSNKDNLYTKIVALNGIYKFLVLGFVI
jgi:hypothetical protein